MRKAASDRPRIPMALEAPHRSLVRRLAVPAGRFLLFYLFGVSGYLFLEYINGDRLMIRETLYHVAVLLTGVGFTDILNTHADWPSTLFTVVMSFLGLGTVLYVISTATAFIVSGELSNLLEVRSMQRQIQELQDHFIVCGGGRTGRHAVQELISTGRPYVLLDTSSEISEELKREHGDDLLALQGDATEDEVLRHAGIARAEGLLASLSEDRDNLLLVITARQLNPSLRIVSRCIDPENERKLRKVGANGVVSPNRIGGLRLVSELVRPTVVSFLDAMLRDPRGIRFEEVHIPSGHRLEGQTLAEAQFHHHADVNVVAARRGDEKNFMYNPHGDLRLDAGMDLILIGQPGEVQKLQDALDLRFKEV